MFLIAGIQPRTRKGPQTDQTCPRCGLARVYERRVDHYFSLFFIPLVRVRKGERFGWCERCQQPLAGMGSGPRVAQSVCAGCKRHLDPGFRFCPYCGYKIH